MFGYPDVLTRAAGVIMRQEPRYVLVAFTKPQDRRQIEKRLYAIGLQLVANDQEARGDKIRPMHRINHTRKRLWIETRNRTPFDERILAQMESTFTGDIDWIAPVYRTPKSRNMDGLVCPIPSRLVIEPRHLGAPTAEASFRRELTRLGMTERPFSAKSPTKFHTFEVSIDKGANAYTVKETLERQQPAYIGAVRFENMPLLVPTTIIPNDPMINQQWNMTQVSAAGTGTTGWDINTGNNTVVVCILDEGCDLTHPDLVFAENGINLDDPSETGEPTGDHGTACAGIAAATFNNAQGVAGVAGACQIMPLAFENWTDTECAAGLYYAADNGANVISMSFGVYDGWGWDYSLIDPALEYAHNAGCVLCAATGNEDDGTVNRYPSRHPLVIACGASDQNDDRKSPTSPDGEYWWGSNYGIDVYNGETTGVSVTAPGVLIPTTDRQGTDGYNNTAGTAGDYFAAFNGTSSATPHVAGLAALLLSEYPTLSNIEVRTIIERTVDKVGTVAYADDSDFPNGSRNNEMGYGRINALNALDFADVTIRDYPGDFGEEPSHPPGGNFWNYSDIVIRITDDGVFEPDDPSKSKHVERGQTNYLYVRVTNSGPGEARNVSVNVRITPWVGTQFEYPEDWSLIDSNHVSPTPVAAQFLTIPVNGSEIAKFSISAAQVEDLWGWQDANPWHPCLLAEVSSDNDYAFATATLASTSGSLVPRRNNFAQRNLTVIDVLADSVMTLPIVVGNVKDVKRDFVIEVDRKRLPRNARVELMLEVEKPLFREAIERVVQPVERFEVKDTIDFLQPTRIEATLGGRRGMFDLARGSRLIFPEDIRPSFRAVNVKGGELMVRNERQVVSVLNSIAQVQLIKPPRQQMEMAVRTYIPRDAKKGDVFEVEVRQRDTSGHIQGGATVMYVVR